MRPRRLTLRQWARAEASWLPFWAAVGLAWYFLPKLLDWIHHGR